MDINDISTDETPDEIPAEESDWLRLAMKCEHCFKDARALVSAPANESVDRTNLSQELSSEEQAALESIKSDLERHIRHRWALLYLKLCQRNSEEVMLQKLPAFLQYYIQGADTRWIDMRS
jgi:hypothetical protein